MNMLSDKATLLEFLHTSVSLGKRDGEVNVECVVRLQLEKLEVDGFYDVFHKKYPFISKNGVFSTKGKAICGDEEFDFVKGKNIAETRAQAKAYKIAKHVYRMIFDWVISLQDNVLTALGNNDRCMENCFTHIEALDK